MCDPFNDDALDFFIFEEVTKDKKDKDEWENDLDNDEDDDDE